MGANLVKALPVNVMQLSLITARIWLLYTVACWDLIARVLTHRGTSLIFSSVHRHFTLYSLCLDYNYRLYLCLIRYHGTTGGRWVLSVGCWCNCAVWGTWLLACTTEMATILRPAPVFKENMTANLTAFIAGRRHAADHLKKKNMAAFPSEPANCFLCSRSTAQRRCAKRIIPPFGCNMHSHIFGFTFLGKWMWNRKCESTWRGNW